MFLFTMHTFYKVCSYLQVMYVLISASVETFDLHYINICVRS